jgi:hypothetical protein
MDDLAPILLDISDLDFDENAKAAIKRGLELLQELTFHLYASGHEPKQHETGALVSALRCLNEKIPSANYDECEEIFEDFLNDMQGEGFVFDYRKYDIHEITGDKILIAIEKLLSWLV